MKHPNACHLCGGFAQLLACGKAWCNDHMADGFAADRQMQAVAKTKRAARHAKQREEGLAFWASRGIALGETVRVYGMSLYGRFPIIGVAKVGSGGAYVSSPKYRKPLDPRGAEKVGV